jgi:transketolase
MADLMRKPLTMDELRALCHRLRGDILEILHNVQTGHPGGSLSACEVVTTLYMNKMNIDPKNPNWEDRDRFVLSKGHAAPILYAVLAELGFFAKEELKHLRQLGHMLQGHPSTLKTPGVDISAGPLGLGLSAAAGMALAAKVQGKSYTTYCMIGDGESNEGGIWEALMSANKFKLDNLVIILDQNRVQLDGTTDEIMPLLDMSAKFKAFGMNVIEIDGHDVQAVSGAIDQAKAHKGQTTVIVSNTVKGKGISFMEGKSAWHGAPINAEHYELVKAELGGAR